MCHASKEEMLLSTYPCAYLRARDMNVVDFGNVPCGCERKCRKQGRNYLILDGSTERDISGTKSWGTRESCFEVN